MCADLAATNNPKAQIADGLKQATEGLSNAASGTADYVGSSLSGLYSKCADAAGNVIDKTKQVVNESVIVPTVETASAYGRDFVGGLTEIKNDAIAIKDGAVSAYNTVAALPQAGVDAAIRTGSAIASSTYAKDVVAGADAIRDGAVAVASAAIDGAVAVGSAAAAIPGVIKSIPGGAVDFASNKVVVPLVDTMQELNGTKLLREEIQIARLEKELEGQKSQSTVLAANQQTPAIALPSQLSDPKDIAAILAISPLKSIPESSISLPKGESLIKSGTPEAKQLQEILNKLDPEADLKVDGYLEEKTSAAISAFQAKNGIKVDGLVGAETIAKLNQSLQLDSARDNLLLAKS